MSSRAGNVILYEDFRDDLLAKAREMVETRDFKDEEKERRKHREIIWIRR